MTNTPDVETALSSAKGDTLMKSPLTEADYRADREAAKQALHASSAGDRFATYFETVESMVPPLSWGGFWALMRANAEDFIIRLSNPDAQKAWSALGDAKNAAGKRRSMDLSN